MTPPQPVNLLDQVRHILRRKDYALRTEETYTRWIVRFIRFHHLRHPRHMDAPEIEAFLTHLAVDENVAASTQNQALARKYPNAAREWGWQYGFPSPRLSLEPRAGQTRRHHLDPSGLQKAAKSAPAVNPHHYS